MMMRAPQSPLTLERAVTTFRFEIYLFPTRTVAPFISIASPARTVVPFISVASPTRTVAPFSFYVYLLLRLLWWLRLLMFFFLLFILFFTWSIIDFVVYSFVVASHIFIRRAHSRRYIYDRWVELHERGFSDCRPL